jgi:hypothetical protein
LDEPILELGALLTIAKIFDMIVSMNEKDKQNSVADAQHLTDMVDKIIGEIGRNGLFPPCQGCGLALKQ